VNLPVLYLLSVRRVVLTVVAIFCLAIVTAHAQQKKPTPAPAKAAAPAAKAAAPAAKAGAPAAGASHTAVAGSATHSPTTTAGSHTTTTTAGAGRTTTTTTNRTTTTAAKTPAGAVGARGGAVAGHGPMSAGHPAPAGVREARAPNGALVRTRADGRRSDLHDERRGMDVHRNLDGNRRVFVERPNHERVFAERGGRGYYQRPYHYGRYEYGHRTYYDHGRYYDRFYNRYEYRPGLFLDVYAPVRYYPVGFYGWAYNPWVAPIVYPWGWGGSPWYGYYGAAYFTPYGAYPSASFWLTDYLISNSLQAAYAAQVEAAAAGPPPPAGPPVLTPEIKAQIASEVQLQVALENNEAQRNAAQQEIDPSGSSIASLLADNKPHVFVVGADLDLVGSDGVECPVSQGDVLQVGGGAPSGDSTTAIVLSSKPWRKECRTAGGVTVAVNDLQDMQNHMRETIDAGMSDLQAKQGQNGLPAAPPSARTAPVTAAFAVNAPPPDQTASTEIAQQTQQADLAEKEAGPSAGASDAASAYAPAPAPTPAAPVNIAPGQTIEQVTASLGQPKAQFTNSTGLVYVYSGMKITFKAGKVSSVQ
jgi:hypothetical protein